MRVLVALLTLSLGCGPDFERPSVVNSLRILAVRADPAAVRPGQATVLTPLVADPYGARRTVTYEWAACVTMDADSFEFLLASDCAAAEDRPILSTDPTLSVPIPAEVADLAEVQDFTGQSGSFGIPVRLVVRAGAEEQIAIVPVAVVLDEAAEPNQNPVFASIEEGGDPWAEGEDRSLPVNGSLRLRATWPPEAAEEYSYDPTGPATRVDVKEVVAVNWYSSIGEIDPDVTSDGFLDTTLRLKARPPQGVDARLWMVISDGRGGTAYTERRLTVTR